MAKELEQLAETQRDVVRALGALAEQLHIGVRHENAVRRTPEATAEPSGGPGESSPVEGARLERALEAASRSVQDLSAATAVNTQALGEAGRQLTALPGLLGSLAQGAREQGGGIAGFLKKGLGVGSLVGLFGRKREPEPLTLTPFREPARLALEAANTQNSLAGFPRLAYGQSGEPRAVESQGATVWQPQVTVNVQAMDSRSFLDHSAEIARAVREAMLHMHPVNDLISEL